MKHNIYRWSALGLLGVLIGFGFMGSTAEAAGFGVCGVNYHGLSRGFACGPRLACGPRFACVPRFGCGPRFGFGLSIGIGRFGYCRPFASSLYYGNCFGPRFGGPIGGFCGYRPAFGFNDCGIGVGGLGYGGYGFNNFGYSGYGLTVGSVGYGGINPPIFYTPGFYDYYGVNVGNYNNGPSVQGIGPGVVNGLGIGPSGYVTSNFVGAPSSDSYAAALNNENAVLRRQVELLAEQNRRNQAFNGNNGVQPVKLDVRLNRKQIDQQIALKERARNITAQGMRFFRAGTYHRAVDRFEESIDMVADDPTPYFLLAQAHFAQGNPQAAAAAIKAGLQISADWLELDFDMLSIYDDQAELVQQLGDLAKALQANPLDRDRLYVLGFELFISGQKDKARIVLEQVARLEPNDDHLQPFFDYFEKLDAARQAVADLGGN